MSLSTSQIDVIKSTVPVLETSGLDIITRFYATVLSDVPALNSVFNTRNQATGRQQMALANAVLAYAKNIENPSVLLPNLQLICNKHASLGVTPPQYDVVGAHLLAAMGHVLGDACTPTILEAWEKAYSQLAKIMIDMERGLYDFAKEWTGWREFKIQQKVPESDEITSFYLVPTDGKGLPMFRPGQYVSLQVRNDGDGTVQSRQYSLSDMPGKDRLRVSVKREEGVDTMEGQERIHHPGYVSHILHDMKKEGDAVNVSFPRGLFFFDNQVEDDEAKQGARGHIDPISISMLASHSAPLVLLSAGVGLTPMMSILAAELSAGGRRRITFVHSAHTTPSRAFHKELLALAKQNPRLTVRYFTSNPGKEDVLGVDYHYPGRMDLDVLKKEDPAMLGLPSRTTRYYICGPTAFMLDMRSKLIQFEVREEKVNLELFSVGGI